MEKASAFLAEGLKLKNVQQILEKHKNHVINYIAKHRDDLNLYEYYQDLEQNRELELESLHNEIRLIFKGLEEKKENMKNNIIDTLDLKSFKKSMIYIQEKILALKSSIKINLQILQDEAIAMEEETQASDRKINQWEKENHVITPVYNLNNFKTHNRESFTSENKEVKEFMDFLSQSNGHENGWPNADHQLFLKVRNKNKDMECLILNLNKLLPHYSLEDLKAHELWYRKYIILRDKKKQALENWRQNKNQHVPHENTDKKDTPIKTKNYLSTKDTNIEEKLSQWKIEKEAKRLKEQEFKQREINRLKKQEKDKRKFHKEIKKSIEKWKQIKQAKEKTEKYQKEKAAQEERKNKAMEANRLIKQFQSKDDFYISKMRQNIQQQQKPKTTRSQSSQLLVPRDADRVFKPTKQWILRSTKDESVQSKFPRPVSNIRTIPKLRVPDWKKKI